MSIEGNQVVIAFNAYLHETAWSTFDWPEWNCCFWSAGWVHKVTGQDPAQPYRGQFSTALGAMRVVKEYGGMISLANTMLARVKWIRVEEPAFGSVIAVPHDKMGAVIGLAGKHNCFFKTATPREFGVAPASDVIAAWSPAE